MASKIFGGLLVNFIVFFIIFNNKCVKGDEIDVLIKPTKSWKFLDKNEDVLPQRFRENIEEFRVGSIECLRFCIDSDNTMDEASRFLHLVWNLELEHKSEMESTSIFDKGFTPQIIQGKSIKSNDSWDAKNRCTFSIVIACELTQGRKDNFSEMEKNFIKSLQPNLDADNNFSTLNTVNKKLVDKNNLMSETETSFNVETNQTEMNAIVLGNITMIDLKMPIGAPSFGIATPQLTLSTSKLARMSVLKLNILNPPAGDWRLKLQGKDNKNYQLIVMSVAPVNQIDNEKVTFMSNDKGVPDLNNHDVKKKSNIASRKIRVLDGNIDRSDVPYNDSEMNDFSESMMSASSNFEQDMQIPFKFPSESEMNDVQLMDSDNITTFRNIQIEDRMIDRESLELDDLSRSFNDELPIRKHLTVDLNPGTNLIANPGSIHRLTFDITNNHVLTIRHYFQAISTPFRIVSVRPAFGYPQNNVVIAPGQTTSVIVEIQIPAGISESVVNKVTLKVQGIENLEKSVNVQVRTTGSRVYDDTRPTIYYYFNNNCAFKTNAEKCLKSHWSVDITVQDSDSGIKSVTSAPRGVYPRTQYVSGTTSPVYLYYSSNCCSRVVELTVMDLAGNIETKRIDVGAWYNLSEGEIAAVVIGTFFIILLIIFIVITILYCSQRRDSHDLPYSQRYGSRSPPRSD